VKVFLGNAFKNFEVGIARALRVRGGGDVFAEIIKTGKHSGVVAGTRGRDGLVESLAGHETLRHAARGGIGGDPVSEAGAFRQLEEGRTEHASMIMPVRGAGFY